MTEAIVSRRFILHNLGCSNCAAKMEAAIRKLDGVTGAVVVYATKTLVIEMDAGMAGVITEHAKSIVTSIEPEVSFVETSGNRECDADISDDDLSGKNLRDRAIRLVISGALFLAAVVISHMGAAEYIVLPMYAISYLLSGGATLIKAARNILKGRVFDENLLMSVATLGAFTINYYDEGVAVMLFFQLGELLQSLAAGRSRRSITALMDTRPDTANLVDGGGVKTVAPGMVNPGDEILVKPGERVPLDGVVIKGTSMADTSALTGESLPREVFEGSEALAGYVNINGLLTIRVTKEFGQSTMSKVLDMMQTAAEKKAPTENFITSFARYYTPVVVALAVLIASLPPLILSQPFSDWIYRALVFLVISCPCALVLSIPLGFFAGIGASSRIGVLVKGSNHLEALGNVGTMVFDKTGTLTKGVFEVAKIYPYGDYSECDLLRLAAMAEAHSSHPIAASICRAYLQGAGAEDKYAYEDTLNTDKMHTNSIEAASDLALMLSFEEIAGHGTKAVIGERTILVGNAKLMEREGISFTAHANAGDIVKTDVGSGAQEGISQSKMLNPAAYGETPEVFGTAVYVAVDRQFAGTIVISDQIKPDAASAMKRLKDAGVGKIVMLTGDNNAVAEATARELGIDALHAELLPDQKVSILEDLLEEMHMEEQAGKRNKHSRKTANRKLAFVGDGINDAPSLARADVGVSMGGLASDAAIEAADVVLMTDEPGRLPGAIAVSRKTKRIVWQNIVFALGVKAIVLLLGAFGIASMWAAVFADVGVALLAVLNALRIMRVKTLNIGGSL